MRKMEEKNKTPKVIAMIRLRRLDNLNSAGLLITREIKNTKAIPKNKDRAWTEPIGLKEIEPEKYWTKNKKDKIPELTRKILIICKISFSVSRRFKAKKKINPYRIKTKRESV